MSRYKIVFKEKGAPVDGMARTLAPEDIDGTGLLSPDVEGSRTHPSGWTITGNITEDGLRWVNEFSAEHPTLGKVWGDYENTVRATSKKAFDHFHANHPPNEWDYGDI